MQTQSPSPLIQPPAQSPISPITLSVDSASADSGAKTSSIFSSKGVLLAIGIVLVALIIGVSALLSFKSKDSYQGMIKKIEEQTTELQRAQESLNTP